MEQEDNINFRRFQEWLDMDQAGPIGVLPVQINSVITPKFYFNPNNNHQNEARIREN